MKLSICSVKIREAFGERGALEMIKRCGFDAVDYSFADTYDATYMLGDDYQSRAESTKDMLSEIGLYCDQAHAPFKLTYGEAFDLAVKNYRDVVRSIEYAAKIGAKGIIVHALKVPATEDFVAYNYSYYKSLEPYAERFGIQIAVENLVSSIFWTPAKLCEFVSLLNSSVFCACVDVGHAAIIGMPPERFIAGMEPGMLKFVHLHDTDLKVDRHWTPFRGEQNWDNIMKSLAEYGFDGDAELEVLHDFDYLEPELYEAMVSFASCAGKLLIKKFNAYKEEMVK